jgi:hypothetical protein
MRADCGAQPGHEPRFSGLLLQACLNPLLDGIISMKTPRLKTHSADFEENEFSTEGNCRDVYNSRFAFSAAWL